jgi:hypothetical protein
VIRVLWRLAMMQFGLRATLYEMEIPSRFRSGQALRFA